MAFTPTSVKRLDDCLGERIVGPSNSSEWWGMSMADSRTVPNTTVLGSAHLLKGEVSQIGRGTVMIPYLDIFRIESSGVLWCGAVTTVETAQERIQKLADSSPGSYLILNQTTGERIVVKPDSDAQN